MNDDDLRSLLRGADPAASLPPADPDRVTDLLEDAVSSTRPTPTPAPDAAPAPGAPVRRRRPWVVALAAAAAAVVLGAVAVPVVRSLAPAPVTTTLTAEPFDPLMSMCAPVADVLGGVDVAFSGRVTAVDGSVVGLDVERAYRGEPGDRVQVDAPLQGQDSAPLVGGFPFEVGGEYLVAASDGLVAVCGASGPATPELLAAYEQTFGA